MWCRLLGGWRLVGLASGTRLGAFPLLANGLRKDKCRRLHGWVDDAIAMQRDGA
ncbi:hypothetical protein MEA186_20022 [Mesorhizobium amorphae CCNWGS0123]|uniref:Uncharacterized protein n=1 Tax=Mesorhizobium amorphae CCNWGS0123 TaxID=1082933 RepID=G6YDG7_9HYPH|nr:hypothetical protein MEA186_20022 [Mesorhizobium amorphae CCNWGS0123]